MSLTVLHPSVATGETGGLHENLETVEAALDYALIKRDSAHTPRHELWQAVYHALAAAAGSKAPADIEAARRRLLDAIAVERRAAGELR